jgi:ribosomal protein S18 acetylase RimI-like enzyme
VPEFTIRPARPADAAGIVAVIRNGLAVSLLNMLIYGCPGIIRFVKEQLTLANGLANAYYIVAVAADRVVACVELRRLPDMLHLNYISVASTHRARGIATHLLHAALNEGKFARYTHMSLDVLEDNAVARGWYDRLGFELAHTTEWWSIPCTPHPAPHEDEIVWISGYPQAQACQRRFGFSQLVLNTPRGEYTVGRIGMNWFRVTQAEAIVDPTIWATLCRLDPQRRVLAVQRSGGLPPAVPTASLVARLNGMSISLDKLRARLSCSSGVGRTRMLND